MALFSHKKKEGQPRKGLPWVLTVGNQSASPFRGRSTSDFTWTDLQYALEVMRPDGDSFVILEQKDAEGYWFLQSAIAIMGPHAGEYTVGCGYSREKGAALLEREVPRLDQVIPYFECVFQSKPLDLSGFEDNSDFLPVNQ